MSLMQQSNNNQIKRKILVTGVSMLNNVERELSKQHTGKVKKFPAAKTEIISEKLENALECKPDMLIVQLELIIFQKI